MNRILIFLVLVVLLAGGFFWYQTRASAGKMQEEPSALSTPLPTTELTYELSSYVEYAPGILSATRQKGTSVLFFAATAWCQTCSALDQEIQERVSEIPSDVTILKVDYDNEKALNKEYFVTAQHTLIVLDETGEETTRWVGGDFDQLLSKLAQSSK